MQEILPKPLKGNSRQTLVRQGSPSQSAELRSNLLQAQAKQKETNRNWSLFVGAPQEIRTPGLRFRRPTLYPAELAAHI